MPARPSNTHGFQLTAAQQRQVMTGDIMIEDAIAAIPERGRAKAIAAAIMKACETNVDAGLVAQEIDRIIYMEGRNA